MTARLQASLSIQKRPGEPGRRLVYMVLWAITSAATLTFLSVFAAIFSEGTSELKLH
jgi:hypothetical protein